MGVENIEKYSRGFAVLKAYLKVWHDKIFYRKVEYVHREKVPLERPLIFTPNHQNALMDALAIEFSFDNQFVFVARSDIFKNKWIARILYFLKILPVYRIRDGYDSLKKNELVFKKTLDIIRNKNGFVIFPEGNHAGIRRLRGLKKGFARIAFQAEEAEKFLLDMRVVPVGINYSDYEHFRSDLLVVFGEAFPVSDFFEDFKAQPAVAYNRIKEKLSAAIKPLIIHIDSQYYDACFFLSKAYRPLACREMQMNPEKLYDQFRAQKTIIGCLEKYEADAPAKMKALSEKVSRYVAALKNMRLEDVHPVAVAGTVWRSLLLVLGLPFFVYGYLNNIFPWNISEMTGRRRSDPQFRSSFKFVLSFLSFPVFYFLQTWFFYVWVSGTWWSAVYFVSLPVSAAVAWWYAGLFAQTRYQWRYLVRKYKKDALLAQAQQDDKELMTQMENIFHTYRGAMQQFMGKS